MVAEALILGDGAAEGDGVILGGEGGEVKADTVLCGGDDEGRRDDRVFDVRVREAGEPRTGAVLGAADEASGFAVTHGGVAGVGGVKEVV